LHSGDPSEETPEVTRASSLLVRAITTDNLSIKMIFSRAGLICNEPSIFRFKSSDKRHAICFLSVLYFSRTIVDGAEGG
jgi:hypothetical protein